MRTTDEIVARLKAEADPRVRAGIARFGVSPDKALGIPAPRLKAIAKEIDSGPKAGKAERTVHNHRLAMELWETDIHEARALASMIASPELLTPADMRRWTEDFDAWDTCDACCYNLFRYTPFAYDHFGEYASSDREYVRRMPFALMAGLAIGDKKAADEKFIAMLPLIERYSTDSRNFVRKAVNWALRQIGKRNRTLHPHALALAEKLAASDDKTARWIGSDARRELADPKIKARIR